jgi:hypothetical protein
MAQSFSCRCPERRKPAKERAWVVVQRNGNASAFNGYRWQYSDWSLIWCQGCHALGRTKAAFVEQLKNGVIDTATEPLHKDSYKGRSTARDVR